MKCSLETIQSKRSKRENENVYTFKDRKKLFGNKMFKTFLVNNLCFLFGEINALICGKTCKLKKIYCFTENEGEPRNSKESLLAH